MGWRHLAVPVGFASGLLALLLTGVVGWLVVPNIIDLRLGWRMALVNESLSESTWASWTTSENLRQTKFYIFNVTNFDQVLNGAKPVLVELGPYVYDEIHEKLNIETEDEGRTVAYQDAKTYQFNQQESAGSEADLIVVPNVPYITAATLLYAFVPDNQQPAAKSLFAQLNQEGEEPFKKVSIKELLFDGWVVAEKPNSAWHHIGRLVGMEVDKFGFYYKRNESISEKHKLYTGINVTSEIGLIHTWEGETELSYWNMSSSPNFVKCNVFQNASSGSSFPPSSNTARSLPKIFSWESCRTFDLKFEAEETTVEMYSIPGARYSLSGDNFEVANKDNECYCQSGSEKLVSDCVEGAYRLISCKGWPFVFSLPHFLFAQELQHYVDFETPESGKHLTIFDIHSESGALLQSVVRSQMNVEIQNLPGYPPFDNMKLPEGSSSLIFPVYWTEETEEISPDSASALYDDIVGIEKTIRVTRYVLLGIASTLTVVCGVWLAIQRLF